MMRNFFVLLLFFLTSNPVGICYGSSKQLNKNRYDLIATGAFGQAYLTHDSYNHEWVVKVSPSDLSNPYENTTLEVFEKLKEEFEESINKGAILRKEAAVLYYLTKEQGVPHIIQPLRACIIPEPAGGKHKYKMELHLVHGSPVSKVDNPEHILSGILHGLAVMHHLGITHNDIKDPHLLNVTDASGRLVPTLIDFGEACIDFEGTDYDRTTSWWRSPELLMGDYNYLPEGDLWALGITIARLMYGLRIEGDDESIILNKIFKTFGLPNGEQDNPHYKQQTISNLAKENFKYLPPNVKGTLTDMLCYSPKKRGTAASLLQKFFPQHSCQKVMSLPKVEPFHPSTQPRSHNVKNDRRILVYNDYNYEKKAVDSMHQQKSRKLQNDRLTSKKSKLIKFPVNESKNDWRKHALDHASELTFGNRIALITWLKEEWLDSQRISPTIFYDAITILDLLTFKHFPITTNNAEVYTIVALRLASELHDIIASTEYYLDQLVLDSNGNPPFSETILDEAFAAAYSALEGNYMREHFFRQILPVFQNMNDSDKALIHQVIFETLTDQDVDHILTDSEIVDRVFRHPSLVLYRSSLGLSN